MGYLHNILQKKSKYGHKIKHALSLNWIYMALSYIELAFFLKCQISAAIMWFIIANKAADIY